jgi:L,D-peptidoglycan transpeptidase YkuD (ErfK/YbiS/YcfS/YnhG family)
MGQKKSARKRPVYRPKSIVLRRAPGKPKQGKLLLAGRACKTSLGRGDLHSRKIEGDGATPIGRFPFRQVLYRADRVARPRTMLPCRTIRSFDAWCEDPSDRNYNRLIRLSPHAEGDRLTRDDHLYDLIIVLGYNDVPRVRRRGSAIFVHLARENYSPTAGCVGLSRHDLLMLLQAIRRGSTLSIMR